MTKVPYKRGLLLLTVYVTYTNSFIAEIILSPSGNLSLRGGPSSIPDQTTSRDPSAKVIVIWKLKTFKTHLINTKYSFIIK